MRAKRAGNSRVLLNRDFDGHYISMAPGEKTKCLFYADDRAFGWIYSGQVKITIDGQEPRILPKGWAFNVAPRLSYCMETAGNEPVVFFRMTPAGQAPSYPESETPTPLKGYIYEKTRITSTGGYDAFNQPFFDIDEYGASDRTGERFLFDGHTSANPRRDIAIAELPPATDWGHFHAEYGGSLGGCLRPDRCADLGCRAGPWRAGRCDPCPVKNAGTAPPAGRAAAKASACP